MRVQLARALAMDPGGAAHGRAVRGARRADARRDAPAPAAHLDARPEDRGLRHPRRPRGARARGPRGGDGGPARARAPGPRVRLPRPRDPDDEALVGMSRRIRDELRRAEAARAERMRGRGRDDAKRWDGLQQGTLLVALIGLGPSSSDGPWPHWLFPGPLRGRREPWEHAPRRPPRRGHGQLARAPRPGVRLLRARGRAVRRAPRAQRARPGGAPAHRAGAAGVALHLLAAARHPVVRPLRDLHPVRRGDGVGVRHRHRDRGRRGGRGPAAPPRRRHPRDPRRALPRRGAPARRRSRGS